MRSTRVQDKKHAENTQKRPLFQNSSIYTSTSKRLIHKLEGIPKMKELAGALN